MTPRDEYKQSAIAVMTAWDASNEDGLQFAAETAVQIEDEVGSDHLIIGLINLCAMLLVARQFEQGISPAKTLQQAATGTMSNRDPG